MKFNFFTQKLASYRVWLASALLLLTFMSGIEAQSISQIVTHVDAATCTSPTGSITINPTGTNLLGDASGYFYLLRIEREGVQALQTPSFNQTQINAVSAGGGISLNSQVPGTYTITTQIWDGNTAGVIFDAKVTTVVIRALNDNVAPTFTTCPANATVTAAACGGNATLTYATPTATDDCGTVNVTRTSGLASGSSVAPGTYTVVHTATDLAGNTATCTTVFTVTATPDVVAPTATPSNVVFNFNGSSFPTPVNGHALNGTPVSGAGNSATNPYQINPDASTGFAKIAYDATTGVFTDNCSVTTIENLSTFGGTGTASARGVDIPLAPGDYKVAFRGKDAAGNATLIEFFFRVLPLNIQLSCIGQVNVSLANLNDCSQVLRTSDVLQSSFIPAGISVEVNRNGVWGTPLLTRADIGKRLEYRVVGTNGNTCWGYVTVEDKSAPNCNAAPGFLSLTCDQVTIGANGLPVLNPAKTGQYLGATNQFGAPALFPTATNGTGSDCSAFTQQYSDVVTPGGSVCLGWTITRTWVLKDFYGNTSTGCTQTIIVAPAPPAIIPTITNYDLACADMTTAGKEKLLEGGNFLTALAPTGAVSCNVSIRYVAGSSRELATCGNSYKILRKYEMVNMCAVAPAPMITLIGEQVINIIDNVRPTVTVAYDTYVPGAVTATFCETASSTPMVTYRRNVVPATAIAHNGSVNITPLSSKVMCGAIDKDLVLATIAGTDVCNPTVSYSVSDSRFAISAAGVLKSTSVLMPTGTTNVGTVAVPVLIPSTSVVVSVIDACNNATTITVNVLIVDNVSPTAVCDDVTATLNSAGMAVLRVANFDRNSTDNCAIAKTYIRKTTAANNGAWCDVVMYQCADLTGTNKIDIRYVDAAGNFTDCCVPVVINDKADVTCVSPSAKSLNCNDPALANVLTAFDEPVVTYNGCATFATATKDESVAISCGSGSYTRTWTYTVPGRTGSAVCSQVITVNPVLGYTVRPLGSYEKSCSIDYETLVNDNGVMRAKGAVATRDSVLARIRRSVGTGTSLVNTCSAPVVEVEYWSYIGTDYCKMIIEKTTVRDLCATGNTVLDLGTIGSNYSSGFANVAESSRGVSNTRAYDNIITWERRIIIKDNTPPTVSGVLTSPVCFESTSCLGKITATLSGSDNCGAGTTNLLEGRLNYTWTITGGSLTQPINGSGTSVTSGATATLAAGTYTITFNASDACGNISAPGTLTQKIGECKLPSIVCKNVNAELMPVPGGGAMIAVPLDDLLSWATDNCSNRADNSLKLKLAAGDARTGVTVSTDGQTITFTCDAAGIDGVTKVVPVKVVATDASGNSDFCIAYVTLQNNAGGCGATPFAVSGGARTESNAVVNNITVSASANGTTVASGDVLNGTYSFTVPASATNVQVRAAKNNNEDAASGVTTFDIAKVSQHVLDIEKLATPYKLIAADVDKSGEVDATDMLHMRRFILKITPALPGGNFRFVDKAYSFRNAANPFGEDFPEVVSIATLTSNASANFVAVKLGDVNDSYAALAPRSSRTLSFLANDMNVVAGNEYTVNISADKMDAAAFQGTFSFNGATVKSVKAGDLANMTDGNFGVFANAVTTSWNGKTQASAEVLAITFVATKSGKLSEMLTINSELTQAVANDATGAEMNVNLKFNTGKVAGGEFALYQNQPNPVANETTIGFNLPKDGTARLTVTAVDGKVVKVINGDYKAGYNTISVNKSDLNATGVFFYHLETADHSASKKMVIIE